MARPPARVLHTSRFASRRREVRRARQRRRRRVTLTVAAVALLALAGWGLARSSLFDLERIEVSGARLLSRADVLQASGLRVGDNMLALDLGAIERRIERLPLVLDASVSKPSASSIRILLTERSPAFVLETPEGRWSVDAGGVVLGAAAADATATTIRTDARILADAGDRIRSLLFEQALALWRSLPAGLARGRIVIEATRAGLSVATSGLTIWFGPLERLDDKLVALGLILERARAAGDRLAAIDLRSPERPAATPA